jgi:mRNA interferase MazF
MRDYNCWSGIKQTLDNSNSKKFFKSREIWWCSLGLNIGDEEFGKGLDFSRPVLIFKKFNNSMFFGVPLSSKHKENKYYYNFDFKTLSQSALLSQVRILSSKRLLERMGKINLEEFENIKKALTKSLFG